MEDKTEKIARAMDIINDSIRTHLGYTYGAIPVAMKRRGESNAFHKKCVREYLEVLNTLAEML